MSTDGTFDALKAVEDSRIRVVQNEERNGLIKDGVMQNWYRLLEMCDGQFAFHLNDRDLIDTEGMADLVTFLKEHQTVTGGICNIGEGGGTSCLNLPKNALWQSRTLDRIQLA